LGGRPLFIIKVFPGGRVGISRIVAAYGEGEVLLEADWRRTGQASRSRPTCWLGPSVPPAKCPAFFKTSFQNGRPVHRESRTVAPETISARLEKKSRNRLARRLIRSIGASACSARLGEVVAGGVSLDQVDPRHGFPHMPRIVPVRRSIGCGGTGRRL